MDNTTILIRRTTAEVLYRLRKNERETYDQTINRLINKVKEITTNEPNAE